MSAVFIEDIYLNDVSIIAAMAKTSLRDCLLTYHFVKTLLKFKERLMKLSMHE